MKQVKKSILLSISRVMNHLSNLSRSILLMKCFLDKTVEIATLVRKVEPGEDIFNPNQPKVILNSKGMLFISAGLQYHISETLKRVNGQRTMFFINISDFMLTGVKHEKDNFIGHEVLLKFPNHLNKTDGLKMATG
jgi:hypothetical protein